MLSRAHRNFQGNWTAIVLAVISIIQGLAFNDLAGRLQMILSYTEATHDLIPAAHFLLAFTLLLRIFQTYITAALDYDEWATNFADVLLIFVIGMLEYHVFSSLIVPGFAVMQFHKRISIVSILALIGYIRAFGSLKEPMFANYQGYRKERRLQAMNIAGVAAVQAISLLILLTHTLPSAVYVICAAVAAAILAFNMGYSMNATFSTKLDTTGMSHDGVSAFSAESHLGTGNIRVRQAGRDDSLALARLMTDHFGYMYAAAFDTSPRMTEKILLNLVRMANGKIPNFGFRSFQVAVEGEPHEVIGLLKCTYSTAFRAGVLYWLLVPAILFYHLGVVGLVRSWRNWRVLSDTAPDIGPGELYIQYIAVDRKLQGTGAGGRLMEYAIELGRSMRKSRVTLDVREPNQTARDFFSGKGFREMQLIVRRSDQFVGKGPTIRMELDIPAPVDLAMDI